MVAYRQSPVLVALVEVIICSKKNQNIEIVSIGTCAPLTGQTISDKNTDRV